MRRTCGRALRPNTRLVYLESPANPLLRLTDVDAVAAMAHEAGALVAVDSTFATPVGFRPAERGADFVVQSLTKYICGHGDAIGGAVLRQTLGNGQAAVARHPRGGRAQPFQCLAHPARSGDAADPDGRSPGGALAVAQHLEDHPQVTRVIYPGLPSHPQYELAIRQLENFSGMLTFQVTDGPAAARLLSERLQTIHYAVSLGHHRSLICYLPTADLMRSSFHLTPEQEASYRAYAGDGVFRLSVGLEDPADLITDIDEALAPLG